MSHLTSDNRNVATSASKPMNSLVPPQDEKATFTGGGSKSRGAALIPPQEEKMDASTGSKPLTQRGAEYLEEAADRLPLDTDPDADPALHKSLGDSVRAGFVDDVGVEEGRRVYERPT